MIEIRIPYDTEDGRFRNLCADWIFDQKKISAYGQDITAQQIISDWTLEYFGHSASFEDLKNYWNGIYHRNLVFKFEKADQAMLFKLKWL